MSQGIECQTDKKFSFIRPDEIEARFTTVLCVCAAFVKLSN